MQLRAMAAVACLAIAAASSWSSLIAEPAIRLCAGTVLAAAPALFAVARCSRRAAICAAVLSLPGAMFVAGVPASALAPSAWPQLSPRLDAAVSYYLAAGPRPATGVWSLCVVLLMSEALWWAGATVGAWPAAPLRRLIIGFILLAGPWLAGVCESTPGHAGWLGALVLIAGVLWFSNSGAMIPLGILAALLSVVIAQAIGPHTRWFGLSQSASQSLDFSSLDPEPTYGSLTTPHTGAPMLEVTSPNPALWRMQTLDSFDGGGWTTASNALPELPEPGARREQITVRVLGLRQDLVVAPGRVDRLEPGGSAADTGGEAWQLAAMPRRGDTYRVVASDLRVSGGRLAEDRAPLGHRYAVYTQLGTPRGPALPLVGWLAGLLGFGTRAPANPAVDPGVVALARRLELGASTEWDKVARVEHFLLDGGRFRYTTRVPAPGPQPLADFLLRTHAGYCQHFAGAAALLLRLAGVPARVVAGFATGRRTGRDQYTVRDVDAHQWIEVYFPGYGWVPFNPTPSASPATIAGGLDPLRPGALRFSRPTGVPFTAVLTLLAGGVLMLMRCLARRRRRHLPEPLERIARRASGPLEPSTTLAGLGVVLARIGPRTSALAAEAERVRFAATPPVPPRHPRIRLARALVGDVGLMRALLLWAPVPRRLRRCSGVVSAAPEEGEDQQR
jgi:Transglutaminase-like superfamily